MLRELQKKDLTAEMLTRRMSGLVAESEERIRKINRMGTMYSTPPKCRTTWTGRSPWKTT